MSFPSTSDPIDVIIAIEGGEAMTLVTHLTQSGHMRVSTISRSVKQLWEDIARYKPGVVILSHDLPEYTVETVRTLVSYPEFPITVIGLAPVMGSRNDDMIAAGIAATYQLPLTPGLIARMIEDLPVLVDKTRSNWHAPMMRAGIDQSTLKMMASKGTSYQTGVVAFYSVAGGTGRTFLAVETAAVISQFGFKRVLVIDANMDGGAVSLRLGVGESAMRKNIGLMAYDYATSHKMTEQLLMNYAVPVDKMIDPSSKRPESMMYFIPGVPNLFVPTNTPLKDAPGQQFMSELLNLAQRFFDYVIVDCGTALGPGPHLSVLETARVVFLLLPDDVARIGVSANTLDTVCRQYNLNKQNFRLVLNGYNEANTNVEPKQVADVFEQPVFLIIPFDPTGQTRLIPNRGKSFMMELLPVGKSSKEVEPTVSAILRLAREIHPPLKDFADERQKKIGGGRTLSGIFGRK